MPQDDERRRLKEISEKCDPKILTIGDTEAIVACDSLIKDRTYYGVRQEIADKPSVRLSWSNGGRSWHVSGRKIEIGDAATCDANEILAPFSPKRMERVTPCLLDLPLYFGSFEAWSKDKIVDQKTALLIWAKGQFEKKRREKGR